MSGRTSRNQAASGDSFTDRNSDIVSLLNGGCRSLQLVANYIDHTPTQVSQERYPPDTDRLHRPIHQCTDNRMTAFVMNIILTSFLS